MLLHLFALLTAAATAVLIFAGGLVTSTGSGLSVPDWPNSYGWFMFTFPVENWVGGIFYEHSHRLIASTVGFLILDPGVLALARGAALVGAQARVHRARRRRHAGHARRHHGAVVPAGSGFNRPRQPGADRVLPHRGHRPRHLAGMAPAVRPARSGARRPGAAARRRRDAGDRLHADRDWRHDAPHGRRPGHPRLSVDVRPPDSGSLGSRRSPSTSPTASARWW